MALAPQHQFQVLTKRPRRLRCLLESQKFLDAVWTEMQLLSDDDAVPLARPVRGNVRTRAQWERLEFVAAAQRLDRYVDRVGRVLLAG